MKRLQRQDFVENGWDHRLRLWVLVLHSKGQMRALHLSRGLIVGLKNEARQFMAEAEDSTRTCSQGSCPSTTRSHVSISCPGCLTPRHHMARSEGKGKRPETQHSQQVRCQHLLGTDQVIPKDAICIAYWQA